MENKYVDLEDVVSAITDFPTISDEKQLLLNRIKQIQPANVVSEEDYRSLYTKWACLVGRLAVLGLKEEDVARRAAEIMGGRK